DEFEPHTVPEIWISRFDGESILLVGRRRRKPCGHNPWVLVDVLDGRGKSLRIEKPLRIRGSYFEVACRSKVVVLCALNDGIRYVNPGMKVCGDRRGGESGNG